MSRVYAFADARRVTFWSSLPLEKPKDFHRFKREVEAAELDVGGSSSEAYSGPSEFAKEIGLSTSLGTQVIAGRGTLIVYLDFWKEGDDRTPEEQIAMRHYLRDLGYSILSFVRPR